MRRRLAAVAMAVAMAVGGYCAVDFTAPTTAHAASAGWVRSGGYWYFYRNGYAATGWVKTGGAWYYLNGRGQMLKGWQWIGGKWYYLNPVNDNGRLMYGWQWIGGKWYYLNPVNESGAMSMGWQRIGGKWYYLNPAGNNGAMLMGWQKISGKWYYLNPAGNNGAMLMGWQKIGANWHYFNPAGESGAMLFGWQKIDGKWYYLNPTGDSGARMTGWQNLPSGGTTFRFYLDPSTGVMATGDYKINGVPYKFGLAGGANEGRYMPCLGYGMTSTKFDVGYTVNATWKNYLDTARARWNNTGVATISWSATATSQIVVDPTPSARMGGSPLYGLYTWYPSKGAFEIRIYQQVIAETVGMSEPTYSTNLINTATHELGHALQLVDNPAPGANASLMNHARNRLVVVGPTAYDVENARRCMT